MGFPPVLAGFGVHLHGDSKADSGLHLLFDQGLDLPGLGLGALYNEFVMDLEDKTGTKPFLLRRR